MNFGVRRLGAAFLCTRSGNSDELELVVKSGARSPDAKETAPRAPDYDRQVSD